VTSAERHLMRAHDSAVSAGQHASRAGDQAGSVEEAARKLADAAATAEREAERAREAAEQAEKAAGVARQAADEAGATAQGHREHEEVRVISRFEAHAAAAAAAGGVVGGNGAVAAEEAPALKPREPLFAKKAEEEGPKRDPLPGFDDVKQPKARIAIDGRFQELNQSFTDLLGYTEAEFQQAVWPPVMDRANLDKHRQQMKDMLAGTVESVDVKTGYVHAQGLLVPVVGKLTLVRENGEPSHFLLETSAP